MSELTPETNINEPTKAQQAAETPDQPGVGYAYMDKTRDYVVEQPNMETEASHAMLNPAYYPRDMKPEELWNEAEKEGQESPGGTQLEAVALRSQVAAGMAEVKTDDKGKVSVEGGQPVGNLLSDEDKDARDKETEQQGQKDLEADPKLKEMRGSTEPQTEGDKVRRKRQAS